MADSGSGDDELERSGSNGFIRETTGEEIDQESLITHHSSYDSSL